MFTAADTPLPPPVEVLESLSLAHVEAEARAPVEAESVESLAVESLTVESLAGPGAASGGQGVTAPRGGQLLRPPDHLLLGQERALV